MSEDLSIGKILCEKKYGAMGLISEKTKAFYVELNKRVEAAILQYSCSITMINVCEGKFMNQTS